jgi:HSP20 family protein
MANENTTQSNVRVSRGNDVARRQDQSLQQNREGGTARFEPTRGIGWLSPFTVMRRMMEDMDRMFEGFGLRDVSTLRDDFFGGQGVGWMPQVDVVERDGKIIVHADLPGLKKDDINVELRDNMLILRGERVDEHRDQRRSGGWRSERSYGSFYRTIPLPAGVDENSCNAQFVDGVLQIEVKLPESSQGRRIAINGEIKKN